MQLIDALKIVEKWENEELGIKSNSEFDQYRQKSLLEKMESIASVALNEAKYFYEIGTERLINYFKNAPLTSSFSDNKPIGYPESQGLIVFFHGLDGDANLWNKHINYLNEHDSEIDFYAPNLPAKGHCSINSEETKTLCNRIINWIKLHPGQPIALIGQSNGTRFALRIETWLRKQAPKTPIHLSLTSGVLFGSYLVDIITQRLSATLAKKIISDVIHDELSHGSKTAVDLSSRSACPPPEDCAERDYSFYASVYDTHVPYTGSSLPVINARGMQKDKVERHYVVDNVGHNSIVFATFEHQINNCLKWMNKVRIVESI